MKSLTGDLISITLISLFITSLNLCNKNKKNKCHISSLKRGCPLTVKICMWKKSWEKIAMSSWWFLIILSLGSNFATATKSWVLNSTHITLRVLLHPITNMVNPIWCLKQSIFPTFQSPFSSGLGFRKQRRINVQIILNFVVTAIAWKPVWNAGGETVKV